MNLHSPRSARTAIFTALACTLAASGCASDRDDNGPSGVGPADGADPGDTGTADPGDGGDDGDGGSDDGGGGTGDDGDDGTDAPDDGTDDGGGGGGCEGGWDDPYPPMPAANSPDFPPGYHLHPGPISTYQGNRWEYSVIMPDAADTASYPVIFGEYLSSIDDNEAIKVFLQTVDEPGFEGPNPWWWDAELGVGCPSPGCDLFSFIDTAGILEILDDLAANVRFDHKRVMFASPFGAGAPFVMVLKPEAQPYFAGVGYWGSEWQQASCSSLSPPDDCPPAIYFAMEACDHSFCPMLDCLDVVYARGWDPEVHMETTEDACPCPPPGGMPGDDRPHFEGRPDWWSYESWLLSTSRE